jgi:hypothetical protein
MAYFELAALLITCSPSTKFSYLEYLVYINIPSFFFVQKSEAGIIVDVSRSLSISQRVLAHTR